MSWGLFVGAKAARAAVRESEDRARGAGATPLGSPTSPRPVSFVVPVGLGILAGCFLATGGLVVIAFLLRTLSGRSSPGEALGAAFATALVCGAPGVMLALLGTSGHRQRERYRRIQALVSERGHLPVSDLARELRVEQAEARSLALGVLGEGHVLGYLDEEAGELRAGEPARGQSRASLGPPE